MVRGSYHQPRFHQTDQATTEERLICALVALKAVINHHHRPIQKVQIGKVKQTSRGRFAV
jgi:hypothetical protein